MSTETTLKTTHSAADLLEIANGEILHRFSNDPTQWDEQQVREAYTLLRLVHSVAQVQDDDETKEKLEQLYEMYDLRRSVIYPSRKNRTTKAAIQVGDNVESLKAELETLKLIVQKVASAPSANLSESEQLKELKTSVASMESTMATLGQATTELTAPIFVPSRDEMAQRLFSAQDLMRLEESRSDIITSKAHNK